MSDVCSKTTIYYFFYVFKELLVLLWNKTSRVNAQLMAFEKAYNKTITDNSVSSKSYIGPHIATVLKLHESIKYMRLYSFFMCRLLI